MRFHLVSALIMVVGLAFSAGAASAQVADGNFEAGSPWPAWTTQTSTNFTTPLCDTTNCGNGGGTATPNSGVNWCWFGGAMGASEIGSIGQSAVIPVGTTTLRFQAYWGAVVSPFSSTLTVSIDGTTIGTLTEPNTAATQYTMRNFPVPAALADGNAHNLLFSYNQPTAATINLSVDDITYVMPGTIDIQTTTIPDAVEQISYSTTITATQTGTSSPYQWSLTGAPGWLTISGTTLTATLSGTPPASSAGTINFDVTITATTSETDTQSLSLTIDPAGALAISTTTMPTGFTGLTYAGTIQAVGGTGPYTWSLASGNLPTGLSLDGSTSTTLGFTGTPSTTGTSNFTIQVQDSAAGTATRSLSIGITTGGGGGTTGGGGGGGGGCALGGATSVVWLVLLLGMAGGAALLRRRAA